MKPFLNYTRYLNLRLIFVLIALLIVASAIYITQNLVKSLSIEERERMEIWAEATRELMTAEENADMSLVLEVLDRNSSIPALIVDENNQLISPDYGIVNLILPNENQQSFVDKTVSAFKKANPPIEVIIEDEINTIYYLYYDVSSHIKNLRLFSYTLLGVVSVFLIIAFMFFSHAKKNEQNLVWVGLSKETAHQLGTPISSLLAWVEILKTKYSEDKMIVEMNKDVNRLRIIAERFSKIGSKPELEHVFLGKTLDNAIAYMKNRTSSKVNVEVFYNIASDTKVALNVHLFEWVIENLYKNAVDAMDGEGEIRINISSQNDYYQIDVSDTGKGIPASKLNAVFQPGYTTKKRGWGLGLSLVKRIVEDYHHGKIFVKESELDKGTTFRIQLKQLSKT